jgi:hypothetical protein
MWVGQGQCKVERKEVGQGNCLVANNLQLKSLSHVVWLSFSF